MPAAHANRNRWWLAVWLPLFALVIAGVTLVMLQSRKQVIALYSSPQEQAAWQEWKGAAESQAVAEGPVRRRPPRADEPPALLLMRDHFAACLGGALVMSSVLFLAFAFLVQGMVSGNNVGARAHEPKA